MNGGGPFGRFSATNGGTRAALAEVEAHEGTMSSALLVSLIDHMAEEGPLDEGILGKIVSRSRAGDCLPSVRAAEGMLKAGDPDAAGRLLLMSERSGETARRSAVRARILLVQGDAEGAGAAALQALASDGSCDAAYEVLAATDPDGGWPQRHNIRRVLDGADPCNPPGEGSMQELYGIYYEWFRGSREAASAMLARSPSYKAGDRDFILASARMSVDEMDWHSARMMYSRLSGDATPALRREMAEACLEAGDPARAAELLADADQYHPDTMMDTVRARMALGDREGSMEALRTYLNSEWADSEDHLDAARMLADHGMTAEAEEVLSRYVERMGADPDYLSECSAMAVRRGDLPTALALAIEAVVRGRGSVRTKVQRARVRLAMGDALAASKECSRLEAVAPDDPEVLEVRRLAAIAAGDDQAVVSACRRSLDSDPGDVDALIDLAGALGRTGDESGASDAVRRAVRARGTRDTYVRGISALLSVGSHRDALFYCREAEGRYPGDPMITRLRGNAEYGCGDYLRASATYAEVVSSDPGNHAVWHSKGMADEARGDMCSALDAYTRAASIAPEVPEYALSRAIAYGALGDRHSAMNCLDTAMRLDPRSVDPMVRKARILADIGRTAEAVHLLDLAVAMEPGDGRIAAERAELAGASDADAEAEPVPAPAPETTVHVEVPVQVEVPAPEPVPEPEPVQELSPAVQPQAVDESRPEPVPDEDLDTLLDDAAALADAGDVRGALRVVEDALSRHPEDSDLLLSCADLFLRIGEYDRCVSYCGRLSSADPDSADAHRLAGMALAGKGDLKQALAELDRAVSMGDDEADIHAARGEVLERMGYQDRAAECYSAAVSRDPGRLDLSERLARMMYDRREMIAADGMLARILRRDPTRVSAILLRAEVACDRKDDRCLTGCYEMFTKCPDPGAESTVRMVRILEKGGHQAEARALVSGRQPAGSADSPLKRHADRILRRAYATGVDPTDRDLMGSMGLDQAASGELSRYLSTLPQVKVEPGTDRFRRLESGSRDAVMKLEWRDIERDHRLPLEKVYVLCGYTDPDEARELVAYVGWAMSADIGRNTDPRLSDMSMRLPKGMGVYDIMRECDLGVYEARVVKSLII